MWQTHIVQFCSVPTNEALLGMLSYVDMILVVSPGDPGALSH